VAENVKLSAILSPLLDERKGMGGDRQGSGRKARRLHNTKKHNDPVSFLKEVMNDEAAGAGRRVQAAIAALRFESKKGSVKGGKKAEREEAAKEVSGGRFSAARKPRTAP
jgi:hypothetical protein